MTPYGPGPGGHIAQTRVQHVPHASRLRIGLGVTISSIATAVPKNKITQKEATERARRLFPHLADRDNLYANTGIDARYACEPADWYHSRRSWEERAEAFSRHAVDLLEEVALKATKAAGLALRDVDAIVVNTITGVAVPSLDALLMNRLDFREDVARLPIFGFGCGGGVAGLSRAAELGRAKPEANILFLSVDLCSLCLRVQDESLAMFVATALFGDGAAGAVLRYLPHAGNGASRRHASIVATGEHFWRKTEHIMGWDIENDGFGVVLSPDLPALLSTHLRPTLRGFLAANGMNLGEFDGFVFHPGSNKILNTVQKALGLSREDLSVSYGVLRDFGNMSSPTVLFAFERAIEAGARGRHLLVAFGPGFSAYFVVVDL